MKNMFVQRKKVSLVLGSGGARGLAHIGVIRRLEENDFDIRSISGCSIGALIGGVYAAGKLDILEKWMKKITKTDIISLLDISWGSGGFFKGEKIIDVLKELIGDMRIEDLPIPFTAVAADLASEKEVWIKSGSLFDAIRASVSLPLFFVPFDYNGIKLVDGGILNPVPIAPTFNDKTDLTIAVNLGGEMKTEAPGEASQMAGAGDGLVSFQRSIKKFFQHFLKDEHDEMQNWGMYDVADRAFDAMQSTIARQKIAAYPPDVDIEIARNACGTLEFNRAAEMIELGYNAARKAIEINKLR